MRAKYLILAIALLCLLALPATALAADDSDGAKVDSSVTTVLDATGGDEAVPVIVYTQPGAGGVVDRCRAQRRRDDGPCRLRRRRRVSDAGRDRRARRERLRRSHRRGQPGLRVRLRELARHHQPGDRPRQGRRRPPPEAPRAPASAWPSSTAASPPPPTSAAAASSAGRTSSTSKKTPYDDAGHGTFVAGLIAGDGTASLPLDQGGVATVQFRGVAPQADIIGIKVLDCTGQGRASIGDGRRALGDRPQGPVQHPRAQPLDRRQPRRARPTSTRSPRPSSSPGRTASRSCAPPATRASSAPAASSPPATAPTSSPSAPATRGRPPTSSDDAVTYYSSRRPDALGRVSPSPTWWLPATG